MKSIFRQLIQPISLLVGCFIGFALVILLDVFTEVGFLGISIDLTTLNKILVFVSAALLIDMFIVLVNHFDLKHSGGAGSKVNLTEDKRKAMYTPVPSRYLSKEPDDFTLGKYKNRYFRLLIDLHDITHCLVIGALGSFKSSTLL